MIGHIDLIGHRISRDCGRVGARANCRGSIGRSVNYRDTVTVIIDGINLVSHRVDGHRQRCAPHIDCRDSVAVGGVDDAYAVAAVVALVGNINPVRNRIEGNGRGQAAHR